MLQQFRASPAAPTLVYVVGALVALPVIVFGVGHHVSGFDCADASWASSVSLLERDGIYRNLGRNVRLTLLGVAVLGVIPLAISIRRSSDTGTSRWLVPTSATAGIWAVYALTFAVSLWLFTCGGQTL